MEAIQSKKLLTPEQVGEEIKAGNNCGFCVPEICEIIQQMVNK